MWAMASTRHVPSVDFMLPGGRARVLVVASLTLILEQGKGHLLKVEYLDKIRIILARCKKRGYIFG